MPLSFHPLDSRVLIPSMLFSTSTCLWCFMFNSFPMFQLVAQVVFRWSKENDMCFKCVSRFCLVGDKIKNICTCRFLPWIRGFWILSLLISTSIRLWSFIFQWVPEVWLSVSSLFRKYQKKNNYAFSSVCDDSALSMIRKMGIGKSVHCRSLFVNSPHGPSLFAPQKWNFGCFRLVPHEEGGDIVAQDIAT